MLFNFIKKKSLDNIYNKIIEQSKQSSFFVSKDVIGNLNLELLQINLSLILWYMKSKEIEKKYLDFLLKKFIKDLESASIELGFAESGLKKKVRKLASDFYNIHDFNLKIISIFFTKNGQNKFTTNLKKKYKTNNTNLKVLENYYKNNISLFLKLELKSFWNADFNFIKIVNKKKTLQTNE